MVCPRSLIQHGKNDGIHGIVTLPHLIGVTIQTDQKIHDDAKNRKGKDEHDPRGLHTACPILRVNAYDQHHRQNTRGNVDTFRVIIEPGKDHHDKSDL